MGVEMEEVLAVVALQFPARAKAIEDLAACDEQFREI
jgi:hypothetical protein